MDEKDKDWKRCKEEENNDRDKSRETRTRIGKIEREVGERRIRIGR